MRITLATGLREILASVIEGTQSRQQLNRLVDVSHALASAFLRSKASSGHLNQSLLSLSSSDLAYDCLGDLFRQDENGHVVHIKAYFEGIDFSEDSDATLLIHLRRLVFSNVNHGLFRMYNDADPSLGRILRNIKLSIAALQNFDEIDRFGETCIVPSLTDPLLHLPAMERLTLERTMRGLANGREHVPALMAKLGLVLRQQEGTSRALPLLLVAYVFRSIYAGFQEDEPESDDPGRALAKEELRIMISGVCREVMEKTGRRYEAKDRLDPLHLKAYASTIEQSLIHRVLEHDGEGFSYYEGLKPFLPTLTKEEYRDLHRSKVEYLGRLAFERLVQAMRKDALSR